MTIPEFFEELKAAGAKFKVFQAPGGRAWVRDKNGLCPIEALVWLKTGEPITPCHLTACVDTLDLTTVGRRIVHASDGDGETLEPALRTQLLAL